VGSAEQRVWSERLSRLHHRQLLLDPVVRQLGIELRRAVADASTSEERVERIREFQDRLGEHLGLGPRPG